MTPDAWKGVAPYAGHPKWDINFIIVGNTAEFSTLTDMDEQALCAADVAAFLCTTAERKHHTMLRAQHRPVLNYKSSKPSSNHHLWAEAGTVPLAPPSAMLCRGPVEAPHTPPALTAHPTHAEALHNEVHSLYNSQSPLLVDPDNLIFTDGSVVTA
jgi:hypothetical protein